MRHRYSVLHTGTYKIVHARGNIYAFCYRLVQQEVLVIVNADTGEALYQLDMTEMTARRFEQVWQHNKGHVHSAVRDGLEVALFPRDGLVLVGKSEETRG